MPVYPAQLLRQSSAEATRAVVAACLDDAVAACARLQTDDAEALHDFRVALRRLRSHLRAFTAWLPLAASWRSRLKALQVATNGGRDLEVQLAWVVRSRPHLASARARAGAGELARRLTLDQARAARAGLRRIDGDFPTLARELTRSLTAPAPASDARYAALVVELGQELGRKLERRLAEVTRVDELHAPHAARIAAKRLRYLVETVAGPLRPAAALVQVLRELQDLLGDLHDRQLLGRRLARLERRERRADGRAGLTALRRRTERDQRRLFHRLERDWLSQRASVRLARRLQRLVDRLEA